VSDGMFMFLFVLFISVLASLGFKAMKEMGHDARESSCIVVRGPATDNAEHLWSAACISNDHYPRHCIESACIAFRGLP